MRKEVPNGEIANLALSLLTYLDVFIQPKTDSKLYTCTRLDECDYEENDLLSFMTYFKEREGYSIDKKYFEDTSLTIYDIAGKILKDKGV